MDRYGCFIYSALHLFIVRFFKYWIYRITLNCRGSLISRIFNRSRNYFNENFWHINHVQERRWTTSQGYAAESARDALQRDTFEVGIALLENCELEHGPQCRQCVLDREVACLSILHCGVRMVYTANSRNYFNENHHSQKFSAIWYSVTYRI